MNNKNTRGILTLLALIAFILGWIFMFLQWRGKMKTSMLPTVLFAFALLIFGFNIFKPTQK